MLKKTFLLVSCCLMAAGFTRSAAQEKVVMDKIVAVVGGSIILYSDVQEYATEMNNYRRENGMVSTKDPEVEALEMLMTQKLLFNQAQLDSLKLYNPSGPAQQAENRVMDIAVRVGGVKELESLYHRPIYDIKQEFAKRIEERMYSEQMRDEILSKVRITPGEVERFYKNADKDSLPVIPAQYVYAQITKFPLSTNAAKQRAKESLLDMRKRIVEGTRFEVLARLYSQDPLTKTRGGQMEMQDSEFNYYEAPFVEALKKLQPGNVSEIVETGYGFHIIQLVDRKGSKYTLRHILIKPEFSDSEMYETAQSLDSLAGKIKADSITFESAALKYSDDRYSKYNGGLASNLEKLEVEMTNVNPGIVSTKHVIDELPPADYNALKNLAPGEVSNAFLTEDPRQNKISKIVKLIEIVPAHTATLKDDYLQLEEIALQEKQNKELRRWITKKIDGMYVRIDPEFKKPEHFENPEWLK